MNINEKVTQVKTYIQEHKKQSIAVGLILLFLIGGSVALWAIPKTTGSAEKDNDNSSMVVSDTSSGDTSSEEEASSSAESEEPQEESTPEETPAESTAVESTAEQTKPTDTKEPTKTETKKENTPATTPTTKPSTGGSTTNKPSNGGSTTNKPSTGGNTATTPDPAPAPKPDPAPAPKPDPAPPVHKHNYNIAIMGDVPNMVDKSISVCNGCGENITGNEAPHAKQHALNDEKGGHHTKYIKVQDGSKKDVIGHKCSCGVEQLF